MCTEPMVVWQHWPVSHPMTSMQPQFWTCDAKDHTIHHRQTLPRAPRLRFKSVRNCHASVVHRRFSAPPEQRLKLRKYRFLIFSYHFLPIYPESCENSSRWKAFTVESLNPGLDDKLHGHGNNSEYFKNYCRHCMWISSVNHLINWIPFHKSVC